MAGLSSIREAAVPAERPAVGWLRKQYLPGFAVRVPDGPQVLSTSVHLRGPAQTSGPVWAVGERVGTKYVLYKYMSTYVHRSQYGARQLVDRRPEEVLGTSTSSPPYLLSCSPPPKSQPGPVEASLGDFSPTHTRPPPCIALFFAFSLPSGAFLPLPPHDPPPIVSFLDFP